MAAGVHVASAQEESSSPSRCGLFTVSFKEEKERDREHV